MEYAKLFLVGYGAMSIGLYFYWLFFKDTERVNQHQLTHGLLFLILASVI